MMDSICSICGNPVSLKRATVIIACVSVYIDLENEYIMSPEWLADISVFVRCQRDRSCINSRFNRYVSAVVLLFTEYTIRHYNASADFQIPTI